MDPFAGVGTTLTTAAEVGYQATGIELLPVGVAAIRARLKADRIDVSAFELYLKRLKKFSLRTALTGAYKFPHLQITRKAFPPDTERAMSAYHSFVEGIRDHDVRFLFWFACLSCLEEVSYTRKDGQYLRWDSRSGKTWGRGFDKGPISEFCDAIISKLSLILEDIGNRNGGKFSRSVQIIEGSCLTELPRMAGGAFELVVTSPPYCNRYDYSRTYALELAILGYDETAVKNLRQSLLSATVENKTKRRQLAEYYRSIGEDQRFEEAVRTFDGQDALHEVLNILYEERDKGQLNNNNIPTMVENYFFEMNVVIHELARVLAPGGHVVMVNDNVQYGGEEIPVDLILSDFAANAGLSVDVIWILPRGKGNSSQQMGAHGRNEIRKCVYVWSK